MFNVYSNEGDQQYVSMKIEKTKQSQFDEDFDALPREHMHQTCV